MLAFLFPGQGSQFIGMGKSLADQYEVARQTFEEADQILGRRLSAICFEGSEDLDLTVNAQPAILVTSVAAYRVLTQETGLHPTVVAGHSLGEISALTCVDSIDLATALTLVQTRADLMQNAVPAGAGAMLAIMGLPPDDVTEICEQAAESDVLSIANYNGPGQLVVSGHRAAVERADALAIAQGAVTRALKVSAPFHCPLMEPASEAFSEQIKGVRFQQPRVPVIDAASGDIAREAAGTGQRIADQVKAPVRWDAVMQRLMAMSVRASIEVGPGSRLSSLLLRGESAIETFSFGDADGLRRIAEFAEKQPLFPQPLGYWKIDDRGHCFNSQDLSVVWAGSEHLEKIDNVRWIQATNGSWMRKYGTMALVSADGAFEVFDSEEWYPREDGAFVRHDLSRIISPNAGIEDLIPDDWLVTTGGGIKKKDGTRIIWPDGAEWKFNDT